MTVRQFIWGWQLLEAAVLFMIFSLVAGHSWSAAMGYVLLTMVLLRALVIGGVLLAVIAYFGDAKLGMIDGVKCWIEETFAFVLLYGWFQAIPRQFTRFNELPGKHHVVLVHGFLCNDGFWYRLAPELQRAGMTVSTVEMPMAFAGIDRFTDLLAQELQRLRAKNPEAQISIVAFSMGGLAARNLPEEWQRECELLTVYSPHQGTVLAGLTGPIGAVNGRQMRPGSAWLHQLEVRPWAFSRAAGFWTAHDTIVLPAVNSRPPFTETMRTGHGHLSAAIDRTLHRDILKWLTDSR